MHTPSLLHGAGGGAMRVSPRFETLRAIQCVVRFMLSDDLPLVLLSDEVFDHV